MTRYSILSLVMLALVSQGCHMHWRSWTEMYPRPATMPEETYLETVHACRTVAYRGQSSYINLYAGVGGGGPVYDTDLMDMCLKNKGIEKAFAKQYGPINEQPFAWKHRTSNGENDDETLKTQ